jgi:Flp pilus assembly protein CpaB
MAAAVAVRTDDGTAGGATRRRTTPRPVLPSGRAVVGGLLLAIAAVVTFITWQSATGPPGTSYVVAGRTLPPGERLSADDVRLVPAELTSGADDRAFTTLDAVVGRVTLGPVGEHELIQQSQLSDLASAEPLVEVSFALARDQALDGRLRSGDRVDVFVTYGDHTAEVVHGARVIGVGGSDGAALGGDMPLTVTIALDDGRRRAELVHGVRAGEVTLVRSTHQAGGEDSGGGDVFRPDDPTMRQAG